MSGDCKSTDNIRWQITEMIPLKKKVGQNSVFITLNINQVMKYL